MTDIIIKSGFHWRLFDNKQLSPDLEVGEMELQAYQIIKDENDEIKTIVQRFQSNDDLLENIRTMINGWLERGELMLVDEHRSKITTCNVCNDEIKAIYADTPPTIRAWCVKLKCKITILIQENVDWRPFVAPNIWGIAQHFEQEILDE